VAPVVMSPPAFPHRRLGALAAADSERHVVSLCGEYDCSTVPALSATLARVIANDHADLVLDLSGVQFMDAATVGVIVRAREFLAARSRCLTLRTPSRFALRVLQSCGIDCRHDVARPATDQRTECEL
jgi:anti-sigma B factor antagonist